MASAISNASQSKAGIELFTFCTPNGFKISILLEELKEAYGLEYSVTPINLMKGEQKAPWYTQLNPNGRIPTIVDHNRNDFVVFETNAILAYLTRHYDPENKFNPAVETDDHSVVEQWVSWEHGGLGPAQAQTIFFTRFCPKKVPSAVSYYLNQTENFYRILNSRLGSDQRDYVAGPGRGQYSIADIVLIGWANMTAGVTIDLKQQFPNVQAWFDRVMARPSVRKGMSVPMPAPFGNLALEKKLADNVPGAREKEEGVKQFVEASMKQDGYEFVSGNSWVKKE